MGRRLLYDTPLHGIIELDLEPIPPMRNPTRWLDADRLEVDDLNAGERQVWKRSDSGLRLIGREPLS